MIFLSKDEIIKRFKIACDCRFGRSKTGASLKDIEAAARKDLLMKYNICKVSPCFDDYDDVLDFVSEDHIINAKVQHVTSDEFSAQRHNVFYEIFEEVFSDHLDAKPLTGRYGLGEALYGVTSDYNLVCFVMSPFTTLDLDFEPYLKIKNAGAEYDLTPDALIVKLDNT